MAESSRRYNLRDTRKKPQGVLLKRWEMQYSNLINNENRRIPLETVKTAIRSAFEDGMFEQWRITLKCQLSGQRIKVPARYADCTHIECFDLEAFLRMKTQKNLLVCPICQKEVEKLLASLRIDEYIETVLSTLPDAMQVELLRDGSFTKVFEEQVVAPNEINDEEPFVQESNTSHFYVKQEVSEDDEYITLSEDESLEEIAIVDMKPISLLPLNMDIKPKINSSSELEQIHSGEGQEIQYDAIESAIQTRLRSSPNESAANLILRKRTLPMNDRQSRTKLSSKRSYPKKTNGTEKLHKCDQCSYASANKGHVVRHMRTHTGEKPFKCDHCSFACVDKSNLNKHMRTHTGEKPYKCDVCPYACARVDVLRDHLRIHTGEKPFKCSLCSFASAHKSKLNIHVRTHTGEKPYRCDVCSYASAQTGTLRNHMRTHTGERPFKCGLCSFASAKSDHLNVHIRTHTGKKPFKCSLCSFASATNNALNVHIRTHTGEKPYKCSECAFAGSSSSHLCQHIRHHHSKESK